MFSTNTSLFNVHLPCTHVYVYIIDIASHALVKYIAEGGRMSGRFVTLCVVGLLGSLFVGYCVYFDRKRRSDPDYKKKVLASKYFSDPLSRALYYSVHLLL